MSSLLSYPLRRVGRVGVSWPLMSALGALLGGGCGPSSEGIEQVDTPDRPDGLCPIGIAPCSDEGATSCQEGRVRRCREQTDGCLGWGASEACPANEACVASACEPACAGAACSDIDARRCAPGAAGVVERCDDGDGDGCLEWIAMADCPAGQVCNQGECATGCGDECDAGATRCEGGGFVTCAEHDNDGCLEWGAPVPCAEACLLGACTETCLDECGAEGLARCDGAAVERCRREDDGCLHWGPPTICPVGTTCSLGACTGACVDECAPGELGCEAGGVVVCGESDGDACADRGLPVACPVGQSCSEGRCAEVCESECGTQGARACDDAGRAVRECRQADADACLEWVVVATCNPGLGASACIDGACAVAPPPAQLKIAEVLYQSEGPDVDVFIELGGPPGTPLAGWALVAVNGSDGGEVGRMGLLGTVGASGRFVIAHPDANGEIAAWADATSDFVDLQNGPDNLLLVWGEVTVDALGYGAFGPSDHFVGEGRPAPAADNGASLARVGALEDTGDNAVDFVVAEIPTPGRGVAVPVRPASEGDLVITELQIDPAAVPDTSGEWIELFNPSAEAVWDLKGCRIESDPDEVYVIGSTLVVAPHGYVVLARSALPEVAPDHVYSGVLLANEGDAVALLCGDAFIDLVTWEDSTPGASWSLDPEYIDAAVNDLAEAWCETPETAVGGADAGTPGAANPPCPW